MCRTCCPLAQRQTQDAYFVYNGNNAQLTADSARPLPLALDSLRYRECSSYYLLLIYVTRRVL
jgi:hypothetical protein